MRGSPVLDILWERETVPQCGPPSRARSPRCAWRRLRAHRDARGRKTPDELQINADIVE